MTNEEKEISEKISHMKRLFMQDFVMRSDKWLIDVMIDIYNHVYQNYQDYRNKMLDLFKLDKTPYKTHTVILSEELFYYIMAKGRLDREEF